MHEPKGEPVFEEVNHGADGSLDVLKLGDDLIINDGQHRCAGIRGSGSIGALVCRVWSWNKWRNRQDETANWVVVITRSC